MKYFLASMPRCGTMSIALLFANVFGLRTAFHQPYEVIRQTRKLVPYDLHNPPLSLVRKMVEKVAHIERVLKQRNTNDWFEACWTNIYVNYLIEKMIPGSRIIIMFREIEDCSFSLWQLQNLYASKHGKSAMVWEHYADTFLCGYGFLLEQISEMKQRPILLKFERYIIGDYRSYLPSLFGIDCTPDLIRKQDEHLSRRINVRGERRDKRFRLGAGRVEVAKKIEKNLEELCYEPI